MASYLSLIVSFCNKIVAMMTDSSLTTVLGAPFIYILLSFFMIWMAANIFITRPSSLGPLFDSNVHKYTQIKSTQVVKLNAHYYNINQLNSHSYSNGGYLTNGSNYSYVWTDGGFKEVYDGDYTESY